MPRLSYDEYVATVSKVAAINARAAKRGFTGTLTIDARQEEVTSRNDLGFEITEVWWDTTITGTPPSYGGYTLQAVLTWDEAAGLITRPAPGVDHIDRTGLREGWCDHCKTNRDRINTYLVRNDATGVQCQVGSTCIKDFLGWSAVPVFLSAAEVQEDVEDAIGGAGGGYDRRWTVDTIVAVSWAAAQAFGYQKADSDAPTKYVVLDILDPHTTSARVLAEKLYPFVAQAAEQAKIVIEWALNEWADTGEYALNLKAILTGGTATARNVGLLASLPSTWARAMDREIARRQEAEQLRNEWYGQPKDKVTVNVTVRGINYSHGQFGTTTIYKLVSDEGYVFTWFSTNGALGETAGATFTLKGTVKAHDLYRERKQTILTRCKIVPEG